MHCGHQRSAFCRDFRNIEAQRQVGASKIVEINPTSLQRIVTGDRLTARPETQHGDQYEMTPQVAFRVVVESIHRGEDTNRLRIHARFFPEFPQCGLSQLFAHLDLTAWKTPAPHIRRVRTANKEHLPVTENEGDGCGDGSVGRRRHFDLLRRGWQGQGSIAFLPRRRPDPRAW